LKLRVELQETAVAIGIGEKDDRTNISVPSKLVKRGGDVRLIL